MEFKVRDDFFERVEEYFEYMKRHGRSADCFGDVSWVLNLLSFEVVDDVAFKRISDLSLLFCSVFFDKEEK